MDASQELPICPICCELLGKYGGPSTLPCGHNGCLNCFRDVQSHNPACPLCRKPFDPQQHLALNRELRDFIDMATSMFMDDVTRNEGWEAFPTPQLTQEHYAHELQVQQHNSRQQHGNWLSAAHPSQHPYLQHKQHWSAHQPAGAGMTSFNSLAGADYSCGSSSSSTAVCPSQIAGAQEYGSSRSRGGRGVAYSAGEGTAAGKVAGMRGKAVSSQFENQHLQNPGLPQSAPSNTQRDVLQMQPPQWLPDSYASHCGNCMQQFKPLLRLRHHCRLCGKLYCHSCSSKQLLLPVGFKERCPQRVCDMCAGLLEPLQGFLVGATAASVQLPVHDALDSISLRSWLNNPFGGNMPDELYKAANILHKFNKVWRLEAERGFPVSLLTGGVRGMAMMSMVKLGAGWSCTAGTGVVVSLQRGGNSWSAPCAAACYGVGWGLQVGGNITDVLLVLRTDEAVRAFASGQTLGFGGALSVAVGPVGRSAEASYRVGGVKDRGAVVGFCCSKGAFLGLSVEGSVTCVRDAVNKAFYGYGVTARQLLIDCSVPQPPAAALLYSSLEELMRCWSNRGLLDVAAAGRCRSAFRSSSDCREVQGKETGADKCWSSSSSSRAQVAAAHHPQLHDVTDVLDVDFFEQLSEEELDGQAMEPDSLVPSAPPLVVECGSDIGRVIAGMDTQQQPVSRWEDELPAVPGGQAVVTSPRGAVADQDQDSEELLYELAW